MDNQIEMFPRDEFEQQTPHNDGDGVDEYAGRVPEPKNIDAISNSSEPQRWDSAELAVPDPQGSTEPDGEATGTSEQASDRKTSPVFEATGLTGDFELSDHAFAFPDTSHEDIVALARDIEATGLLEEITLAWPQEPGGPPEVVDGKRQSTRLQNGGRRANLPAPPPRDRSQALRLVQERREEGPQTQPESPGLRSLVSQAGSGSAPDSRGKLSEFRQFLPVPPKGREQKLRASAATSSTWPTRWLTPTAEWLQKSGMPSMPAPFP